MTGEGGLADTPTGRFFKKIFWDGLIRLVNSIIRI